jgi:hypothetical protein
MNINIIILPSVYRKIRLIGPTCWEREKNNIHLRDLPGTPPQLTVLLPQLTVLPPQLTVLPPQLTVLLPQLTVLLPWNFSPGTLKAHDCK